MESYSVNEPIYKMHKLDDEFFKLENYSYNNLNINDLISYLDEFFFNLKLQNYNNPISSITMSIPTFKDAFCEFSFPIMKIPEFKHLSSTQIILLLFKKVSVASEDMGNIKKIYTDTDMDNIEEDIIDFALLKILADQYKNFVTLYSRKDNYVISIDHIKCNLPRYFYKVIVSDKYDFEKVGQIKCREIYTSIPYIKFSHINSVIDHLISNEDIDLSKVNVDSVIMITEKEYMDHMAPLSIEDEQCDMMCSDDSITYCSIFPIDDCEELNFICADHDYICEDSLQKYTVAITNDFLLFIVCKRNDDILSEGLDLRYIPDSEVDKMCKCIISGGCEGLGGTLESISLSSKLDKYDAIKELSNNKYSSKYLIGVKIDLTGEVSRPITRVLKEECVYKETDDVTEKTVRIPVTPVDPKGEILTLTRLIGERVKLLLGDNSECRVLIDYFKDESSPTGYKIKASLRSSMDIDL